MTPLRASRGSSDRSRPEIRRDASDAVAVVTLAIDPVILVGVPLRHETSSQWWLHWLTSRWMPRGAVLLPAVGHLVHDARNKIVEEALGIDGWKTLVMLDADVFPSPHEECEVDAFELIKRYSAPVVGPLCFGRSMTQPTPVAGRFATDSTYYRLSHAQYERLMSGTPALYRMDVLGLGLVAFQREVFERLEPPWFSHPVVDGQVLGEDVQLYRRLKDEGIRVYLDTRWHALHLGYLYYGKRTYEIWRSLGGTDAVTEHRESLPAPAFHQ